MYKIIEKSLEVPFWVIEIPEGGLFIESLNDIHGSYENKPPIYEKFIGENKRIRIDHVLNNGLMYSYQAFQLIVLHASTTYTNYTSYIKENFITHKNPLSLSNEKVIECFSFIACKSMIVSNK